MIKRRRKSTTPLMRRSARVFLNDLNAAKADELAIFLTRCRDIAQYFVDRFWQRQDFSAKLADLPDVHAGRDRFSTTSRLAQALSKQAKEAIRSVHALGSSTRPTLRRRVVTLCSNFVTIEAFRGTKFDLAVRLIGSGAPRMTVPVKSTVCINRLLVDGWAMSKTIRLGIRDGRLFIDFLFEKPRPALRTTGCVVGMDSNYKAGLVFSDGQIVGQELYATIQKFSKRQKHTHDEIASALGNAVKRINFDGVRTLCIEDLKRVKDGKRGTFPRVMNRRLSHWLYRLCDQLLSRRCEELGIDLQRKNPWKTSQFCRICRKWDRRNRSGDRFCCVNCGHADNADLNAAKNLELLGLAGVYGLRSLK